MTRKMLIDATHAEETRVVVVDGNKVDEFDFESLNKRQLAGNIYLAKITRVEPSLQAAFVDYGGNRHGFLAFSEVHPDYYQIPKADREALLAEEAALAHDAEEETAQEKPKTRGRSRTRRRSQPASEGAASAEDATTVSEPVSPDAERALQDAPPPSAASGEIEIYVPDEPADNGTDAQDASDDSDNGDDHVKPRRARDDGEYESLGGDDVAEERGPRKPRARRYKIQEVIKVRQILLVQVVKEERGNKGAALTTYLSLAGRYCVLMPNTARGGGISRKITNAADRKKLKEISGSITVPQGAGLIIRTAGAARTKTEIKRDYEYLLREWEQIRDLTMVSMAPAPIYEEGSLIKRVIRDLYSRDIDEILVDGERGYREAKDYMKMLMPSHARNVKFHAEPLPLFSRFQVESYLSAMFNPVVQLKSGGYIVIDVTEALVAVDVNSGRATREASIEDTALKTNLEAAEEAARQMRLRDLAGLIVIDFIDMDDRRNNAAVEKKLKDKLKSDRARIQIGRISGFGLLEMSRQRLRPGMIEATTKACAHCHGTGRVRSDDSLALALLREVEEEGVKQRSKEVLIAAPIEIANYLLNQKREHIAMIEMRFGLSVRVEGDATLVNPDYRVERFKTASRIIPSPQSLNLPTVAYPDEEEDAVVEEPEVAEEAPAAVTDTDADAGERSGTKRKRRRRRRGGRSGSDGETQAEASGDDDTSPAPTPETEVSADGPESEAVATPPRPKSRRRSRSGGAKEAGEQGVPNNDAPVVSASPFGEEIDLGSSDNTTVVDVPESEAPRRSRTRVRKQAASSAAETSAADAPEQLPAPAPAVIEDPVTPNEQAPSAAEADDDGTPETAPVLEPAIAESTGSARPRRSRTTSGLAEDTTAPQKPAPEAEDASGPKRRGWWSRALGGS